MPPDLNANLLFTWRRQAGARRAVAAGSGAAFVPAIIEGGRSASASPTCAQDEDASPAVARSTLVAGRMEIVLAGGDRVVVGSDVNEAALVRVVAVLVRR